jgi:hypothetical protein
VQGLALFHSHISFVLFDVSRDSKIIQTQITTGLLSAFSSIFGASKADDLVEHEFTLEEKETAVVVKPLTHKYAPRLESSERTTVTGV